MSEDLPATPLAVGTIVTNSLPEGDPVRYAFGLSHGAPFGTVKDMRKQFRTGKGWGRVEYLVTRFNGRTKMQGWHDENHLRVATLDEVLTYFEEREQGHLDRIKKLREMVGKKVPKYNPDKHLGRDGAWHTAFRHEDGSLTYVYFDPDPVIESPRTYDGNVATLIQKNTRCIDLDDDDAGLNEAQDRFSEPLMRRYLAMFRPDIVYYTDHWSVGQSGSYGWGYITREDWETLGIDRHGLDPEEVFDAEVKVYGQWAEGEVYASCHIAEKGDEPQYVGGHLGYGSERDIAAYHTDSPILEVLA